MAELPWRNTIFLEAGDFVTVLVRKQVAIKGRDQFGNIVLLKCPGEISNDESDFIIMPEARFYQSLMLERLEDLMTQGLLAKLPEVRDHEGQ